MVREVAFDVNTLHYNDGSHPGGNFSFYTNIGYQSNFFAMHLLAISEKFEKVVTVNHAYDIYGNEYDGVAVFVANERKTETV